MKPEPSLELLRDRQQALLMALAGSTASPGGSSGGSFAAAVGELDDFLQGLPGPAAPAPVAAAAAAQTALAPGLQAYRLNASALAGRALLAVYPRLQQELGEASFTAMAWAFWRRHWPERSELAQWGGALAEFLGRQADMDPALPDLARLEWALHRAESAADAALDGASLALLAEVEPEQLRLCMRPGLCVLEVLSPAWRCYSGEPADAAMPQHVSLLVWRQDWRGQVRRLDAGAAALLRACLAGQDLQEALRLAASAAEGFDFSLWLQEGLRLGWLQGAARMPAQAQRLPEQERGEP